MSEYDLNGLFPPPKATPQKLVGGFSVAPIKKNERSIADFLLQEFFGKAPYSGVKHLLCAPTQPKGLTFIFSEGVDRDVILSVVAGALIDEGHDYTVSFFPL